MCITYCLTLPYFLAMPTLNVDAIIVSQFGNTGETPLCIHYTSRFIIFIHIIVIFSVNLLQWLIFLSLFNKKSYYSVDIAMVGDYIIICVRIQHFK